jgi:hypothetical protein
MAWRTTPSDLKIELSSARGIGARLNAVAVIVAKRQLKTQG